MRNYLIFFILFIRISPVLAQQEIKFLPVQQYQFYEFYPLINPASSTNHYKYDISAGHRGNAGEFKNTYISYLAFQSKFFLKDRRYHSIGINFVGNHDGQYFRKNQAQLNYAWHTPLSANLSIGAGISLGAMNYQVLSTPISAGASSITSTGNAGIWVYGENYFLGASINQFPNGRLVPYDEVTRMVRHYNFTIGKEWILNERVTLKSAGLVRYSAQMPINTDIYFGALLADIFSVGTTWQYKKGMALTGALEGISLMNNKLSILFSYQVYTPSNTLSLQTFEFGLRFFIKDLNEGKREESDDEDALEGRVTF